MGRRYRVVFSVPLAQDSRTCSFASRDKSRTLFPFLSKMYRTNPDFVFTVTRDFVRQCETPVLVLPDDIPPHPYAAAMETALLAPNSQVSLYPWKENDTKVAIALRHVRQFLQANAA